MEGALGHTRARIEVTGYGAPYRGLWNQSGLSRSYVLLTGRTYVDVCDFDL